MLDGAFAWTAPAATSAEWRFLAVQACVGLVRALAHAPEGALAHVLDGAFA
ncbi:MAG TPA: hypothetical protein VK233_10890 [Candidatus Dormibacteraeota bacterium]|nr:hypothetical protein [Candidatus Dormibacteraeota bacterium]